MRITSYLTCVLLLIAVLSTNVVAAMNEWSDDFGAYGGDYDDGIVWEDGNIQFQYTDPVGNLDVLCYDNDRSGSFSYWKCWSGGSAELSACKNDYPALQSFCDSGSSCSTIGLTSIHSLPSANLDSADKKTLSVRGFYSCGGNEFTITQNNPYHIINEKRTYCSGASYELQGGYDTNQWVELETISCGAGSTCDATQDETTCSTETCALTNPCRRAPGSSCNHADSSLTNDCLDGLTCSSGTCTGSLTTDLAIVDIIPVQVIPGKDLIKGKKGYVIVNVTNQGNNSAYAHVEAWLNGIPLTLATNSFSTLININDALIPPNNDRLFIFQLNPLNTGSDLLLNASVEVIN